MFVLSANSIWFYAMTSNIVELNDKYTYTICYISMVNSQLSVVMYVRHIRVVNQSKMQLHANRSINQLQDKD